MSLPAVEVAFFGYIGHQSRGDYYLSQPLLVEVKRETAVFHMFLTRLFWKTNVFWLAMNLQEISRTELWKFSSGLLPVYVTNHALNSQKSGKFLNFFLQNPLIVYSSSIKVNQIAGPSIVWTAFSCRFNYLYIVFVLYSCTLHSRFINLKTHFYVIVW